MSAMNLPLLLGTDWFAANLDDPTLCIHDGAISREPGPDGAPPSGSGAFMVAMLRVSDVATPDGSLAEWTAGPDLLMNVGPVSAPSSDTNR